LPIASDIRLDKKELAIGIDEDVRNSVVARSLIKTPKV